MVDLQTRITCRLTISVNFPINTITCRLKQDGLQEKFHPNKTAYKKNFIQTRRPTRKISSKQDGLQEKFHPNKTAYKKNFIQTRRPTRKISSKQDDFAQKPAITHVTLSLLCGCFL